MDKDIKDLDSLLGFLEATYGDPNCKVTTQTKLENLNQGKKGFLNHFAEFHQYASDTDLNESTLIMQLQLSLSKDLKQAMIGAKIPDNMNNYANMIIIYDNDL